jgi:hypothetical protein
MDKVIIQSEKVDLSGQDIIDITNGETNILEYSDLHNIHNIDDVFNNKPTATILYQTKQNFGHWVVLIKHDDKTIEFFDSYGLAPDEELKYSEFNLRIHGGQQIPHLSHLINDSNYHMIYNKVRLQKWIEDVNTCGRHCAVRIKMRHLKLSQYIQLMTKNKYYNPDFYVSALTLLYSV